MGTIVRRLLPFTGIMLLLAVACSSSGTGRTTADVTTWSDEYQRVLHPYYLFVGFDRAAVEQSRLTAKCMNARGWDTYPLVDADVLAGGLGTHLNNVQLVEERLRIAQQYGQLVLATPSADAGGRRAYDEFSSWLSRQPAPVRAKYQADLNGGRSEDEAAADGTCKAEALSEMRSMIPSSVVAVEARAGKLYGQFVTNREEYREAERQWKACMRDRGFPVVGPPLTVANSSYERGEGSSNLSAQRRAEVGRVLTEQAVAEHECAVAHIDEVVRKGELLAVQQLIEDFPEYQDLVRRN